MTHAEPTRTRQEGTKVTLSGTPEHKIDAIRQIVARGQYAKIDGTMVDLFSASAILAVYDKLSAGNQELYRKMPVSKMAVIAFKLLK